MQSLLYTYNYVDLIRVSIGPKLYNTRLSINTLINLKASLWMIILPLLIL